MGVGSFISVYMLVMACLSYSAMAANTGLITSKSLRPNQTVSQVTIRENRNDSPDFELIVNLVRGMQAERLLRYAGPRLEVVLRERESTCTNRAAYAMMRNFFQKHPIRNFKVLHKGVGESAFLMGIYKDQAGGTFKVRIFFGARAGKWEITRLVFR